VSGQGGHEDQQLLVSLGRRKPLAASRIAAPVQRSDSSGAGVLRATACFIDLHAAQRGSHDRRVQAKSVSAAREIADDLLAFGWASVLDIRQQRGAVIGPRRPL
jgi:hypothetical protein